MFFSFVLCSGIFLEVFCYSNNSKTSFFFFFLGRLTIRPSPPGPLLRGSSPACRTVTREHSSPLDPHRRALLLLLSTVAEVPRHPSLTPVSHRGIPTINMARGLPLYKRQLLSLRGTLA